MLRRFTLGFLAVMVMGTSGSAEAARAPSPFEGSWSTENHVLNLEISSRGSISGAWGIDFSYYSVSGRISNDGLLEIRFSRNDKRRTDRIDATGLLELADADTVVGYIQIEDMEPMWIVLTRR